MRNYINGDAMQFHYRRNQMFPMEPESLRINKEIRDWFDMEALQGNKWESSYLDDTTPGTDDVPLPGPPTTEPQEDSQMGDYMADDAVERGRTGDTTSQGSSSGSLTTKMNSRRAAQLLRRTTVIKGQTKAASVKRVKAKL